MDKINLFEELSASGYKIFLATSYTSDLEFFEKTILRPLLNNGCTYVGLYLDDNQLKDLNTHRGSALELGHSYVVKGVPLNNAFHPKVYLMLGEDKAKLILGSGNLTPAGFITNAEVFNAFHYTEEGEGSENLHLIQSASAIFQELHQLFPSKVMKSIIDKMEEFSYLSYEPGSSEQILLHNLQDSIYGQIEKNIKSPIKKIDILVPYFDQKLSVIKQIQEDYGPENIRILLQDRTTNFPFHREVPRNTQCQEIIYKNHDKKRYHGKMFGIHTQDKEYILYGSANCSRQALLESMGGDGNLEACILEEMPQGSIQRFFQEECELKEIHGALSTIEMTSDDEGIIPVFFEEAIKSNNKLEGIFRSKEPIKKIMLNERHGDLMHTGDKTFATWEGELGKLPSMLEFRVQTQKGKYIVVGWYHDEEALKNTQLQLEQSVYSRIKDDPFISDYKNIVDLLEDLLDRLILGEEDMQRKNIQFSGVATTNQKKELSDEEDVSDNTEDYYAPDEDQLIQTYGSMGGIDVLGQLIHQLLNPFSEQGKENQGKSVGTNKSMRLPKANNQIELSKVIRNKMYSFIKKFNKGLASETFLNELPQDILITNIVIYTQFLKKLRKKNGDLPIIQEEEFLNQWLEVIRGLCRYGHRNIIDHEDIRDHILPYCFAVIVSMDQMLDKNQNFTDVIIQRKELGKLLESIDEYIHPIRKDYMTYLDKTKSIMEDMQLGKKEEIDKMVNRLEKKFTYMYFYQFKEKVNKKYELNQNILPSKSVIAIKEEIKFSYYFNLDKVQLLNLMINIVEWRKKEIFTIQVYNTQKEKNISQWTLNYDINKKQLKQITSYKNGNQIVQIKTNVLKSDIIMADKKQSDQFLVDGFNVN